MNYLLTLLYVRASILMQVEPIPPDSSSVPEPIRFLLNKLGGAASWIAAIVLAILGVFFIVRGTASRKERGYYFASAVLAFLMVAFVVSPAGQSFIGDSVNELLSRDP